MADQKAFECPNCKGQRKVDANKPIPECCGQTMAAIPLDQCTLSATAEHSRFDDFDEPCDDGREG